MAALEVTEVKSMLESVTPSTRGKRNIWKATTIGLIAVVMGMAATGYWVQNIKPVNTFSNEEIARLTITVSKILSSSHYVDPTGLRKEFEQVIGKKRADFTPQDRVRVVKSLINRLNIDDIPDFGKLRQVGLSQRL